MHSPLQCILLSRLFQEPLGKAAPSLCLPPHQLITVGCGLSLSLRDSDRRAPGMKHISGVTEPET